MGHFHEKGFAWALSKGQEKINRELDLHKKRLLSPLNGKILEIGIGTGGNISYYHKPFVGIDINPYMFSYCKRKNIALIRATAEYLPFRENYFDHVVCTHVLCSVHHQRQVLLEMHRVLKRNGEFIFIEHVRGKGSILFFQKLLKYFWRWLGLGCTLDRETGKVISQIFSAQIESFNIKGGFIVSPHIAGKAKKISL